MSINAITANPAETTKPAAISCRQKALRLLTANISPMRDTVNTAHPNLTETVLMSLGMILRVNVAKNQGKAPGRIGQLNHSCLQ